MTKEQMLLKIEQEKIEYIGKDNIKMMESKKEYGESNVYEASKERIRFILKEFDNICISFSGGKDSTIVLNLVLEVLKEHPQLKNHKQLYIYHCDYEAQYSQTTEFVLKTIEKLKKKGFEIFYICMPFKAQCATSMFQPYWRPWAIEDKDKWLRQPPEFALTEENHPFDFWNRDLWDSDFNFNFACWLQKYCQKHQKISYQASKNENQEYLDKKIQVVFLTGLRADENLDNFRAIYNLKKSTYKGACFSTKLEEDLYNFYPIYDWTTEDIWVANAKFGWEYNSLYDLFFKAGMSIHKMRVASAFNDCAISSLNLYRNIDPDNWGGMLCRVNGVNGASILGGTKAMAWKEINLPKGHTWESYCNFLLSTLPKRTAKNYQKKFLTSIKFWKTKGGGVSDEAIEDLKKSGTAFTNRGKVSKQTNKDVITFEKYPDDICIDGKSIKDFAKLPTFKRMCICILKNDHNCKYMGFAPTKEIELAKKSVLENYKNL